MYFPFRSLRAPRRAWFGLAVAPFATTAAPVDFVREVRPIFEQHCYECHGEKKQKSGLRLDVKEVAFKGGDASAPNIVPGNAAGSPLLTLVTAGDDEDRMPPKGDRLSPQEIATLTRWIEGGAVWPDGVDTAKVEDKRDHWSFKPLQTSTPPATRDQAWPRAAIDRFVLARLEEAGLRPTPPADRATWLRRVTFDLIGLPPTPEQVAAFLADQTGGAEQRVVEALLASPRHGERWAQHWLDVVRFADTHGFEVNTERPNAWPYRDYVIRAFNQDTPYDAFIREQIAGDGLNQDAATGFLVTASVLLRGQIGKDAPSLRLARQDSLDEIVVNVGQTFLGLSVGCARCHDHKFDPISQRDYYALQAFVAGVEYEERDWRTPEADARRAEAKRLKLKAAAVDQQLARFVPLANSGAVRTPVTARANTDRFAPVSTKRIRFTIQATRKLEPCLDELEVFDHAGANVALATAGATATSSGETIVADRHDLRYVNDGTFGDTRSWLSNEDGRGWVELEFPREHVIDRVVWSRDREGKYNDRVATQYVIEVAGADGIWRQVAGSSDRAEQAAKNKPAEFSTAGLAAEEAAQATVLQQEKKTLDAAIKAAELGGRVFAGSFRQPDEIRLLQRGDPEQPKEPVEPAVPVALGDRALPRDTPELARRQALADWIASPANPLTARVMVNRIWQGHFGPGLVDTPSDFGRNGTRPSHPALLDWLAAEFIRSGWSVKHLHRLIVLSATYRQAHDIPR
ncbi:PSD1 and planctomycete cytochrome C domain-containing protein [Horticoccus sp. 23ND18S-11]|uniref:PSD1 and planctomycete cytochrome C domain-containing protein n=1 Tax=Horticoccus sp. 23ND18S-11 TaxID=3391832 RepID=UPI0039C97779